jgi:hypothetical protein
MKYPFKDAMHNVASFFSYWMKPTCFNVISTIPLTAFSLPFQEQMIDKKQSFGQNLYTYLIKTKNTHKAQLYIFSLSA